MPVLSHPTDLTSYAELMISYRHQEQLWQTPDGALHLLANRGTSRANPGLVLLSSYLGTVAAAAGGSRQYGGVMGKADRMLVLAMAAPTAAFMTEWPALTGYLAVIAAGSVITMWQRSMLIREELKGASYR